MKSPRFASWAAVSSLPQAKKISLEDQLKTNREHIAKHGGQLVAELVVPGESRSIILFEDACRKINAYAQLRDLIAERAFDVLIYLDPSRLGRKASLAMAIVELCNSAGIVCYETESPPTTLEAPRTSYDDMLIQAIKSVGAQREVMKIQERHKMGMIDRINRGKFPSKVPWGWRVRYSEDGEKSIELDPAASRTIRRILVEMYLEQGKGREGIAEILNKEGVLSPEGRRWHNALVGAIINKGRRYAGWTEINRLGTRPYVRAPGDWPAIITQDELEAIETERNHRRNARRAVSNTYLFSLCCWCKACNRRMIMATNVRQRKSRRIQKSISCRGPHPFTQISEAKVYRAVRAAIEFIMVDANRESLIANTGNQETPFFDEIKSQNEMIQQADSGLLKADDMYVAGKMSKERYQRQVDRLTEQIAHAKARIAHLQQQLAEEHNRVKWIQRLDEIANDGLAMLDHPDVKVANAWIRRHFQIWLEEDRTIHVKYI